MVMSGTEYEVITSYLAPKMRFPWVQDWSMRKCLDVAACGGRCNTMENCVELLSS
jgi:hypothetical protein